MESKHSGPMLPSQQHLSDWDFGLLRLIPSNSVSPVVKSLCEADTLTSVCVREQINPESPSNTDPFGFAGEDFLWTDFSFLDTILATPDPMGLDISTSPSNDDSSQADQLANVQDESSAVSSVPTMATLPVSSAIVCGNADNPCHITGTEALPEPETVSITSSLLGPIYPQYDDLVQASILEGPSARVLFTDPAGKVIDHCESLGSNIPTPSSVSSRSSSRTSSTSTVDSILSNSYWSIDPYVKGVVDSISPTLSRCDNGHPAALQSESQTVSNGLLESLHLPDAFFDFALSDSVGPSKVVPGPEESLVNLMALPVTTALMSDGPPSWDSIDLLLDSSSCGFDPTTVAAESPGWGLPSVYPMAVHKTGLNMKPAQECVGHHSGIMGIPLGPKGADTLSLTMPLPPPLMTVPPPTPQQPLVDVNAFQFCLPRQEQVDQAVLDEGSIFHQPIGSCSQYQYAQHHQYPPPHLPQQTFRCDSMGGHHLPQQQQQQPHHFGYFQVQVEGGHGFHYGGQALPSPPVSSLKRRRRLTTEESEFLLRQFGTNERPTAQEREGFAKHLKLDRRTIQVWFQNRRAKLKRDERAEDMGKIHGQDGGEDEENVNEEGEEDEVEEEERRKDHDWHHGISEGGSNQQVEPFLAHEYGVWDWDLQRTPFLDPSALGIGLHSHHVQGVDR